LSRTGERQALLPSAPHSLAAIVISIAAIAISQCWPPAAWLCLCGLAPLLADLRARSFLGIWLRLTVLYAGFGIASMWWVRQTGSGVGWVLLFVEQATIRGWFEVGRLDRAAGFDLRGEALA
jgi:hypothetical protein